MTPHLNRLHRNHMVGWWVVGGQDGSVEGFTTYGLVSMKTVHMRGHNIWFRLEIRKKYHQILPFIQRSELYVNCSCNCRLTERMSQSADFDIERIVPHVDLVLFDNVLSCYPWNKDITVNYTLGKAVR